MAHARRQSGEPRAARAFARESVRLNHPLRDPLALVLAIDLLALLAAEEPDPDPYEARVLQGAAHRLWTGVGTPFFGSRTFTGPHHACARRTRAALTGQQYEEAFRLGARLDLDTAVHRALGA
ncbi:hypothetical protein [Kitasatospora cheerisanensis]|uniref:hypothetical protein n=1 Tax=Kitasatospora cheerisanensis TaxID=81942 RepID=UPI0012EDE959|nr:hypothetical protein [Kitasatospora cheerisanensis]